jgi:glycosyltransferase involved in cell wall biosynthesis
MRILYLLYNQQDSLNGLSDLKINLPWVDALLDELVKYKNISIALAVPLNYNIIQKSQKRGITVFGLPNPVVKNIFKKAYRRLTRATVNVKLNSYITNVVSDFEPDIIQIFGSENPFGLIVKQQNKPVIIHIQGYSFVCQGKWFKGISKWEQFRYASLKDLLLMRGCYNDYFTFRKKAETEAFIIKNSKYFMGRTNFDKGIVSLISPGSKYFHCEEFIRKEFFENRWNFPHQNKITCVSILKGTSYKGIDLLVEALLILKKYSTVSFKFKICGVSANEEIIRIIKKKYKKEINLIDIEFLGNLTANDLVKQLCSSNFYIHPSYIENSPNSICEAMALGMPIIATDVGGVSSMIEDKVEGILVQEGEPYSLAGAIVDLTNNYEKAIELGCVARKKAFIRHQPDDILKNLLKIYEEIIYEDGRKDLP